MAKYRKKPVVIEAFQLPAADDDNVQPFHDWAEAVGFVDFESGRDETLIVRDNRDAVMTAQPGDWIIKGVEGEFYVCPRTVFEKTYEAVPE